MALRGIAVHFTQYQLRLECGCKVVGCGERAEKLVVLMFAIRQQAGKIALMQQIIFAVD